MFGDNGFISNLVNKMHEFAEPGSLFSSNPDWPNLWILVLGFAVVVWAIYHELTHDVREEEDREKEFDQGAGIIEGPFTECGCESHHVHERNGEEGCPECNSSGKGNKK